MHAAILTKQRGGTWILCFTGQRGVQLFYIVSAFTLCMSLDRKQNEHHPLANYFIRRFFRIAPLFYVVVLANLFLRQVAPAQSALGNSKGIDIILGCLFLNGLSPHAINGVVGGGWSIAVETTFYVCLPFLYKHFKGIRATLLLFAVSAPILLVTSTILAVGAADVLHEQYFSFLWFPVEFPVFVLGMIAYYVWNQYIKDRELSVDNRREISALLLTTSFMIYCACLPFHDVTLYFSSSIFLPLLLALSMYRWPLLVNRFTSYIGTISYSLYLIHSFIWSLLNVALARIDAHPSHLVTRFVLDRFPGLLVVFVAVLGFSLPVCMLTRRFIEVPAIDLGRRFIARRERSRAMQPAGA